MLVTVYRFQQKIWRKGPTGQGIALGPLGIQEVRWLRCQERTRTRHRKDTLSRGHAATGSLRTLGPGIKEGHVTQTGTHRLRALGITSPFDLPEDPYYLFELIAIVLTGEYIFFRLSSFFSSIIRNPWVNPQGAKRQDKLEQVCE